MADRPRLLLHVCCAPCATHAVVSLSATYAVTGFFANSNIATFEEYARRLAGARQLATRCGIPLVEDAYEHAAWLDAVRGLEAEPERGRRCEVCFRFNLARAAAYAAAHGFDRFTTTLTISPHKDAAVIFRVGRALGPFLEVDLKKQGGFQKSLALTRDYGLYRQNTCGCEFSAVHRPAVESEPLRTLAGFMTDTYGGPLHRVPVDFGLGCPHRAPDGSGGCAFCPPDGGRAPHTAGAGSLAAQVAAGAAFARRRYGATRFIAYVQAHTGTCASAAELAERLEALLALMPFDVLCVGTRPDCLADPILDVLAGLRSRLLDVWVELGIQTVHDPTLALINRGHDWATGRAAILRVARRGLRAAAHIIVGLPGEEAEHDRVTATQLAELPLFAVKIHNLHVVRDSALADMYRQRPFPVLDERAYAARLIDILRRLPPAMAVMRINTDTPRERLIAPQWRMDKGTFRNYVVSEMRRRGVRQGDLFEN
jgi:radical SAM protein (TIGR01212 family)